MALVGSCGDSTVFSLPMSPLQPRSSLASLVSVRCIPIHRTLSLGSGECADQGLGDDSSGHTNGDRLVVITGAITVVSSLAFW